jgi:hypothetical protein
MQEDVMLYLIFGSMVVGFIGLWLMRTRFGWGLSLIAIVFAFWAYGGMTEYSVRRGLLQAGGR